MRNAEANGKQQTPNERGEATKGNAQGTGACLAAAVWVAAALGLWAAGCAPSEPVELIETREAMTTEVTIRVIAVSRPAAERALEAAWREMDEGVRRLDRHRPDSDIARVSAQAGQFSIEVDPLVTSCLGAAREVYDLTGGAFDPTVAPLLDLWRRAQERGREPTEEELAAARALVGLDRVEIEAFLAQKPQAEVGLPPADRPVSPEDLTRPMYLVTLPTEGMALDLGGIAKGYIIGRMVQRMSREGVVAALVDAGGDVYAMGERPMALAAGGDPSTGSGSPRAGSRGDRRWAVGIQDPRWPEEPERLYTALRVRDQAVVTSGHYARGYVIAGKHYSHILDPRTGRPVDTRLASVTVVAPDAATADGLATGIAVLGTEKGLDLVERTAGVECLLLETDETAPPEADGKPRLVAHRSSGFAALEFRPGEAAAPECPVCY
jgi:thiamine biosynthesis lipoprotein